MSLLTLVVVIPLALLKLFRALLLGVTQLIEEYPMKSAAPDVDADTEIVPAEIIPATVPARLPEYPSWLDEFDHQIQALVQLAREGNRIAFNIVCDLQAKHSNASDQAGDVAKILERPGRSRA